MLRLKKGTPLGLLPDSYALLCTCRDAATGEIYYENYLFFFQPPGKFDVRFQTYRNNPSTPGAVADIEPLIWARAFGECYAYVTDLYGKKGQSIPEGYQLADVDLTFLIYLTGISPTALQRIEKTTKCKELDAQLTVLRHFLEEYKEAYRVL